MELAVENRHKTTVNTEWGTGMFWYLRVPQGYLSLGGSNTKHTDAILDACPGKPAKNDFEKIINDIQWSENMEDAFFRICSISLQTESDGLLTREI